MPDGRNSLGHSIGRFLGSTVMCHGSCSVECVIGDKAYSTKPWGHEAL